MFGIKDKTSEFHDKTLYTIDDYLDIEAGTTEPYEFYGRNDPDHFGIVSKRNEHVYFKESISKFEKTLSRELANKDLQVFSNFFLKKKKVWIEAADCIFYPDLFVVGNEIDFYPDREDIVANPLMIIEVSTYYSMASMNGKRGDQKYLRDRTNRFRLYRKLSSLKEYVLITDVGETIVETYKRLDDKAWKYQVYSKEENNLVHFESIDIKLPVSDFYL